MGAGKLFWARLSLVFCIGVVVPLSSASFARAATFTPLTLQNGWTDAPLGTSSAAVTDIAGIVHFKGGIHTVGSNPFRDRLGYWMDVVADGQEVVVTRHGKPRLRLLAA